MMPDKRIIFLDCPIDSLSFDQVTDQCLAWCNGQRHTHTIITVNASILTMMQDDKELYHACTSGDLILADGMSVIWGAKLAGTPLAERIAGVELMDNLLEKASQHQLKVFFLGAREEVVSKLVDICRDKHPELVIAGYHNGYFKDDQQVKIADLIKKSNADFLFVGMPSPFKEVWCEKYRDRLQVPLTMGVGGSFDVLAGFIRRAPSWPQNIGMEWFWRLLMEPRKMWKRYLTTNSLFIWLSFKWIINRRF